VALQAMLARNIPPYFSNFPPAYTVAKPSLNSTERINEFHLVLRTNSNLHNTIRCSTNHQNILCRAYREGLPLKMVQGLLLLAFGTSFMAD
jgi:hypothetical protein